MLAGVPRLYSWEVMILRDGCDSSMRGKVSIVEVEEARKTQGPGDEEGSNQGRREGEEGADVRWQITSFATPYVLELIITLTSLDDALPMEHNIRRALDDSLAGHFVCPCQLRNTEVQLPRARCFAILLAEPLRTSSIRLY